MLPPFFCFSSLTVLRSNKKPRFRGFLLLLLLVVSVLARDWVELAFLVLLAWILLVLIIKARVVDMTLPNAVFVAS